MFNLAYQQLSEFIDKMASFKTVTVPAKGWVRAIRGGLGMSRRQLAGRLGLSVSRIQRLEQDEVTGSVTLKTLRRTAEAMDCVLVYAIVPITSLDETLQKQARKKAKKHLQALSHTISLEAQALDKKANQAMLDQLTQQMIEKSKRQLWDED